MSKKIMFNDKYGLTQAVLEGRKTMTRRICKYDRPDETYGIVSLAFEPIDYNNDRNVISTLDYAFCWKNNEGNFTDWNIPKYKVGEVVAIAQSYETIYHEKGLETLDMLVSNWKNSKGWRNNMFVRSDLMSHHIRIANIKIERLQAIPDEDCIKEGVIPFEHIIPNDAKQVVTMYYPCQHMKDCANEIGWGRVYHTPREAFASLIDKVSGRGTWNNNPYVFAYEFELID